MTDKVETQIAESLEEEPEWLQEESGAMKEMKKMKEEGREKKYTLELFISTDGKHTVHVTTDDPNSRREAVAKAMEIYDYLKARYGTKQAQAVKEYRNGNFEKGGVNQETCPHTNVAFKQSRTEKNPGRWFKSCRDCGKFLGWQS